MRNKQSVLKISNSILSDKTFLQWRSSQVAAACVACGRDYCHLFPTWPASLQETTGYHIQSLSAIMDHLR